MIPVQPVSSREMDLLCNVDDWKSHSYCASGVTIVEGRGLVWPDRGESSEAWPRRA